MLKIITKNTHTHTKKQVKISLRVVQRCVRVQEVRAPIWSLQLVAMVSLLALEGLLFLLLLFVVAGKRGKEKNEVPISQHTHKAASFHLSPITSTPSTFYPSVSQHPHPPSRLPSVSRSFSEMRIHTLCFETEL